MGNPLHRVCIGTYTGEKSRGIYSINLDLAAGTLSAAEPAAETAKPSWLAVHPTGRWLFAKNDTGKHVLAIAGEYVRGGGWQNRAFERNVYLAPGFEGVVPVRCIEHERWSPSAGRYVSPLARANRFRQLDAVEEVQVCQRRRRKE